MTDPEVLAALKDLYTGRGRESGFFVWCITADSCPTGRTSSGPNPFSSESES